jgi:hypothetical protein
MATNVHEAANEFKVIQTEVPTYFIDGVVGSAFGSGVHRILCGEFVVDPSPEAVMPAVRHVMNITIPTRAIPAFIQFLQEMPGHDAE